MKTKNERALCTATLTATKARGPKPDFMPKLNRRESSHHEIFAIRADQMILQYKTE